ncbi:MULTISPECIES: PqqD family protein [Lacticaseibacillus]|uniref:Coenzyme PQQ biosynthesis protein PqqD, pqqD n=3 Tax=Lacticaseibacillus TaxID=2759736 RepID=A0AAN1EZR3_LACCA|nr:MULTISPECIES: PqqD family protein [Lacticaseibacillus]ARY92129.1 coenzyme PQQ biosynthesis protein PqqD, pqqD [Lacticaseibacillus casei]KAB1971179.1 PqqD family protein [Lacticaseibacillus casei]WLV77268.1 PqqD family protein [Lacticaseibacillus sp. NCIMB 15471]WLV80034.1 PqqD family protein [Lacticaseibacillus sp. NCIMB 15473]WNX23994.1 PqqD family protein [Lacticaseibacillus casei]
MTQTDMLTTVIYRKNPQVQYTKKNGKITIIRPQNHAIQRFCRKVLHMKIPEVSYLHLDAYGSFVFSKINGRRTAAMIGKELAQKFPEADDQRDARLALYLNQIAEKDHLIQRLDHHPNFL